MMASNLILLRCFWWSNNTCGWTRIIHIPPLVVGHPLSKRFFCHYRLLIRPSSLRGAFIILLRYITTTNHPLHGHRSSAAAVTGQFESLSCGRRRRLGLMDGFSGLYWVIQLRFVGTQCLLGNSFKIWCRQRPIESSTPPPPRRPPTFWRLIWGCIRSG